MKQYQCVGNSMQSEKIAIILKSLTINPHGWFIKFPHDKALKWELPFLNFSRFH